MLTKELLMPQMGYDMQEGTVARWLKAEGAEVRVGEAIAEIETDKAVVEFESDVSGVLEKILVQEGTTVAVGRSIALIGSGPGVSTESVTKEQAAVVEDQSHSAVRTSERTIESDEERQAAVPVEQQPVRASPVARKLVAKYGLDVAKITGTGPGGRITKEDVLAFAAQKQEAEGVEVNAPALLASGETVVPERMPLTSMRQQIARVTVASKQEKPHFYISCEIDMTRAMDLRHQMNEVGGDDSNWVTVNDVVIKACVEALKKHPKFNAFLYEDGIQLNNTINIGLAIAEEEGLIVPAIINCADKSLKDVALATKDLVLRAKKGTLHPQEYTGGTFAISNLGTFDVTSFMAIIHPPQSAVLAVGAVTKRAVVKDDQITIAKMMTATLSADHRIVDGAEGANFLVDIKRFLENPLSLLGVLE